ncbi:hypothetical protein B7463_g1229, partial [Scytalidium lignicola]
MMEADSAQSEKCSDLIEPNVLSSQKQSQITTPTHRSPQFHSPAHCFPGRDSCDAADGFETNQSSVDIQQKSTKSIINDTQFANVESDNSASREYDISPTSSNNHQQHDIGASNDKQPHICKFLPTINHPNFDVNDIAVGFKFSKPSQLVAGQFIRPHTKPAEAILLQPPNVSAVIGGPAAEDYTARKSTSIQQDYKGHSNSKRILDLNEAKDLAYSRQNGSMDGEDILGSEQQESDIPKTEQLAIQTVLSLDQNNLAFPVNQIVSKEISLKKIPPKFSNASYKRIKQPFPDVSGHTHSVSESGIAQDNSESPQSVYYDTQKETITTEQDKKHLQKCVEDILPSTVQQHLDVFPSRPGQSAPAQGGRVFISQHPCSELKESRPTVTNDRHRSLSAHSIQGSPEVISATSPTIHSSGHHTAGNSISQDYNGKKPTAQVLDSSIRVREFPEFNREVSLRPQCQSPNIDTSATYYSLLHAGELFIEIEEKCRRLQIEISKKESIIQQLGLDKRQYKQRIKQADTERSKMILKSDEQVKVISDACTKIKEIEKENCHLQEQNTYLTDIKNKIMEHLKLSKEENAVLVDKYSKVKKSCEQFRNHMNEVIHCQKVLREDSLKLQDGFSGTAHEMLGDLASRDKRILELELDISSITSQLKNAESQISGLSQINSVLKTELDLRLVDLGRERKLSDQLQKKLDRDNIDHTEVVELLSRTRADTVDRLAKAESLLENMLNLQNLAQVKIEEVSDHMAILRGGEAALSPRIVNFVESLFTRFEGKLDIANYLESSLKDSRGKLLKEFKESLGQLQVDQEELKQLREHITQLQNAEEALMDQVKKSDLELETSRRQSETLSKQLTDTCERLNEKTNELGKYTYLSNNQQQQLLGQIQQCEGKIISLETSLRSTREEASHCTEKLHQEQERFASTEEEFRQKLDATQNIINEFAKEKRDYIAECKLVSENSRSEVLKTMNAKRAEMTVRHEAERKEFEKRCLFTDKRLHEVMEDLRERVQECESHKSQISELQHKLLLSDRQIKQMEIVEDKSKTEQDHMEILPELQKRKAEIAQLREIIETAQREMGHCVEGVQKDRKEIDEKLTRMNSSGREDKILQDHFMNLRKIIENFGKKAGLPLADGGRLVRDQEISKLGNHQSLSPESELKNIPNGNHIPSELRTAGATLGEAGQSTTEGVNNPSGAIPLLLVSKKYRNSQKLSKRYCISKVEPAAVTRRSRRLSGYSSNDTHRFNTENRVPSSTVSMENGTSQSSITECAEPSVQDVDLYDIATTGIRPFSSMSPVKGDETNQWADLELLIENMEPLKPLQDVNGVAEAQKCREFAVQSSTASEIQSQNVQSTQVFGSLLGEPPQNMVSDVPTTNTPSTPQQSLIPDDKVNLDDALRRGAKPAVAATVSQAGSKRALKSALKRGTSTVASHMGNNQMATCLEQPAVVSEVKSLGSGTVKKVTSNLSAKRGGSDTPYNRVVRGHFSKPVPLNTNVTGRANVQSLGMTQTSAKAGLDSSSPMITGPMRYSLKRSLPDSNKDLSLEKPPKASRLYVQSQLARKAISDAPGLLPAC